jgi:hypothetical protein
MITPPAGTKSFYAVLLENSAAKFAIGKLVTEAFSADIERVLVTSLDMVSDLEVASELFYAVEQFNLLAIGQKPQILFNPLYLPGGDEDIANGIDISEDGELNGIAGFTNPYTSMGLKLHDEQIQLIDAKVNFQQFQLPALSDILNSPKTWIS